MIIDTAYIMMQACYEQDLQDELDLHDALCYLQRLETMPRLLLFEEQEADARLRQEQLDSMEPEHLMTIEYDPGRYALCTVAPWYVKYLCTDGLFHLRDEFTA